MANVVNGIKNIWGMFNMNAQEDVDEEYEDGEDYAEEIEEVEEPEVRSIFGGRKNNKVTPIDNAVKMVVMQPTGFENAEEICDLLKARKSIIINLEYVNKDVARRIIDVIGGAAHVLDGHMQKISNSIFLIAPYNYDISTDVKEETKSKFQFRA
mgnify:CR=1 FL=1